MQRRKENVQKMSKNRFYVGAEENFHAFIT